MLNSRRAIAAAAFILIVFFLIARSHDSSTSPLQAVAGNTDPNAKANADSNAPNKDVADSSSNAASPNAPAAEVEPPANDPRIDTSHMSTYDKLAYAYPYDVATKFPAYIWQTWKYSATDPKFAFRDHQATWSGHHPNFVHEIVTDDVAYNLVRLFYASVPEVIEAYNALPMPVLKADFFRYLILFARGGIYTDIDTWAIRPAIDWMPENVPRETVGLVIGIEADPDRPDWEKWYSRRIQFCQWTIQAKAGHPALREIITRITKDTLALKQTGRILNFQGKDVVEFTGPAVWTDTVMAYLNDERFFDMKQSKGTVDWRNFTGMEVGKRVGDVVVLPITSFSPGVGQMGSKEIDDPMAFVKHQFEGTWKPEHERHIGEQPQEGEEAGKKQ